MEIPDQLHDFLAKRRLLSIATVDENSIPWISNVYYSSDDDLNLFFISPEDNNHSRHIAENKNISFSIAWYNEEDLGDRKSVQGKGVCEKVTNIKEMANVLKIHLKKYPDWKDIINLDNIVKKVIESKVYRIKPSYIKFWNDELYGDEGTEEFFIS